MARARRCRRPWGVGHRVLRPPCAALRRRPAAARARARRALRARRAPAPARPPPRRRLCDRIAAAARAVRRAPRRRRSPARSVGNRAPRAARRRRARRVARACLERGPAMTTRSPDAETERRIALVADLRAMPELAPRRLVGTAIVFNTMSEDLGGFREVIAPSAIERTLHEKLDVRALVEHDPGRVLGRLAAPPSWDMVDDTPVRTIHDMRVREISVVAFPAFTATDVSVAQRSLADWQASGAPPPWRPSRAWRARRLRLAAG